MQFDKAQIIDMLRQHGQHDQADQADQALPEQVDSEQHADLLQRFGLDPQELISRFTSGGGNIPGIS
jgi:hypothetical protein